MPNHVRNILTVIGPARDVANFVLLSSLPRPRTADLKGSPNYQDPACTAPTFDFHGVVPLPEAYSTMPYDDGRAYGCQEMEREVWGCKWGPYNHQPARDVVIEEHKATFAFTIAWGTPRRYYAQASMRFPQCVFAVSYGGEGPCWGREIWQGGQKMLDLDGQTDRPRRGVEYYLQTHAAWVKAM